jgi:hypothetical protein
MSNLAFLHKKTKKSFSLNKKCQTWYFYIKKIKKKVFFNKKRQT